MSHPIRFQNVEEAQQMALVHPMTLEVIQCCLKYWVDGQPFCVNEIARGPDSRDWNPASWHCQPPPWRAVDVRLRGVLSRHVSDRVASNVNAHYQYDPHRQHLQVAVIHEPYHLHIQTHPRTARKR